MKHLKHREKKSVRFAVCLNNSGYKASLELHKIYRIIPDEDTSDNSSKVISSNEYSVMKQPNVDR